MTVFNGVSQTAVIASPPGLLNPAVQGGRMVRIKDSYTTAASAADLVTTNSIYLLPLPSNAVLHSLKLYNTCSGSNVAASLILAVGGTGFKDVATAEAGSTPGTAYAANASFSTAGTIVFQGTQLQTSTPNGAEVLYTYGASSNFTLANGAAGKMLWEIAGLNADPVKLFCILLQPTTNMSGGTAGVIMLEATVTVGS